MSQESEIRNKKKRKNRWRRSWVQRSCLCYTTWSEMDVNLYGNDQDSEYTEVNNGVDQNRNPACAHVPEFHHSCPCR